MTYEQWVPVAGSHYSVSSHGRVRRDIDRWGRKRPRIRKLHYGKRHGYFTVDLYTGSRASMKRVPIHRLVAFAFLGDPPTPKHEVNHKNGVKTDNRPENLEWVTRGENHSHAFRMGLKSTQGELHGLSRLQGADIIKIRRLCAQGNKTQREIATLFDIDPSHVSNIKLRKAWAHV